MTSTERAIRLQRLAALEFISSKTAFSEMDQLHFQRNAEVLYAAAREQCMWIRTDFLLDNLPVSRTATSLMVQ